jgi:cytochrome bd-type quinol oxidase subunit 2
MLRRKKILFLTVLIFSLSLAFPAYVFAAGSFSILGKPVVDIINDLIKWILLLVGRISLLMLILGGIFYVISGSSPENQEKAKKVVTAALLGLILVLVSYSLINAIDMIFVRQF